MKHIKKFENYEKEIEEHAIKDIVDSYLSAALWTSEEQEDFDGLNDDDFSEETEKKAFEDVEWFVKVAGKYLNNISDDMIGHDLWLTRNGHGAGFWDRGYDEETYKHLVDICDFMGYADIYVSDDGKIEINSKELRDSDIEDYKLKKVTNKYNL